eukprot:s3581_g4.t1
MANEERKRSAQAVSQRAQTQQAKGKAKAKAGPKAAAAAPPAEDQDLQDSTNKGYYLQVQADIEKVLQEFGGEDFCKAMPLSIGGIPMARKRVEDLTEFYYGPEGTPRFHSERMVECGVMRSDLDTERPGKLQIISPEEMIHALGADGGMRGHEK